MSKAEIYLYIGRAVIAIYLLIVFILVIAETVERNNIGTTEPTYYQETRQVMDYVTTNLAATPLQSLTVLNANTSVSPSVLSTWSVDGDWCWCRDAQTNQSTKYPYLGTCTDEDLRTPSLTCTQMAATDVSLEIWKGASLSEAEMATWSYPVSSNYTCESSFDEYQQTAGLCRRKGQAMMTQLKAVNATETTQSTSWTLAGSFASQGNSSAPQVNVSNLTNTSIVNETLGLQLYWSSSLTGSPFTGVKVNSYGLPCLNPYNSPAPSNATTASYPLTGSAPTGCGYWNSSDDLFQSIDVNNLWDYYLNNDWAENTTWFEDLYGFQNSTANENSYIFAERKLIVADSDFCYAWVRSPAPQSNIEDIPNLNSMREALDIVGFVVVAVAVVAFVAYIIATRSSKSVTKEGVGVYIFWFEHGLGCLYAVVALVVGGLTNDITATIDSDNTYLNDIASAGCVTNVPVINNVYVYLADGISALYDYVEAYNDWNVYVSIVFLVLELILLVCWLIIFSCHENLEDEENQHSETRQLRNK